MPKITALIHTCNDELRLGRTLDSLRACDQVIVVDHGSSDNTEKVARDHGAEFKKAIPGVDRGTYAVDANNDWILCLCANESLGEPLEAALFEWKEKEHAETAGFNLPINWTGELPPTTTVHDSLSGDVLKFNHP